LKGIVNPNLTDVTWNLKLGFGMKTNMCIDEKHTNKIPISTSHQHPSRAASRKTNPEAHSKVAVEGALRENPKLPSAKFFAECFPSGTP
jgi:hypothetical protein